MALNLHWRGRAYKRDMGANLLLPLEIGNALARGAMVVTANQRAARMLHRAFDRSMKELGRGSWQPASILAFDSWATGLWHRMLIEGSASRMLLNRTQEHAIWRGVIAGGEEAAGLRSTDSLAEMASGAWLLLANYSAIGRLREIGISTDTRAFQRWALAFGHRCIRDGYLSQAELALELDTAARRGEMPIPTSGLLLVGFDQLVPAQKALFATLRGAGYTVEEASGPGRAIEERLVEAKDERDEISAAARWARQQLERNGSAQLSVIVPGMEARRAEIDRTFREVLAPELQDISADAESGPYEFSLGRPLAATAMGMAALDLLRWPMQPLPMNRVSELLLSPYFGGGSQVLAEFDAFVVRRARLLRPEIRLNWIIEAIAEVDPLEELRGRLEAMRDVAAAERMRMADVQERSHAEWADAFRKLLQAAGWPGQGQVDSVAFQTHRRWESALDELATLDFDGTRATSVQAFAAFERIVTETIFAAESREAPVQLMGPLEAAGQQFDGIWFLGASDLAWPPQAATTPLLPWLLQKELGMPGTDAARDAGVARAITRRLAGSAPSVVFSYAAECGEGKQHASALVAELQCERWEDLASERLVLGLETVEDETPLPGLPDRLHPGGAAVLQLQAACGFRAFAEQRLWATEPDTRDLGMDARDRGNVVHKVMERFWIELGDQPALRQMTTTDRERLLDQCIEAALAKTVEANSSRWDLAYIETQRQRLRTLLRPWLMLELGRPAFSVRHHEKELKDVAVGPLRLSVRVDRVDDTEGGPLILDYKTGQASPNDWLSDRPDAPQLPLYAILSNSDPIGGVAFAVLRAGDDLCMKGYAVDTSVLTKPTSMRFATLEDQVDEWRRVLTSLAVDFCAGDARVAPKRYPTTCCFCAQRILCRLDPSTLQDEEEANGLADEEMDRD